MHIAVGKLMHVSLCNGMHVAFYNIMYDVSYNIIHIVVCTIMHDVCYNGMYSAYDSVMHDADYNGMHIGVFNSMFGTAYIVHIDVHSITGVAATRVCTLHVAILCMMWLPSCTQFR